MLMIAKTLKEWLYTFFTSFSFYFVFFFSSPSYETYGGASYNVEWKNDLTTGGTLSPRIVQDSLKPKRLLG